MSTTTIEFKSNGERGKRTVTIHPLGRDTIIVCNDVSRIEFLDSGFVHIVGNPGQLIPQLQIGSIEYGND